MSADERDPIARAKAHVANAIRLAAEARAHADRAREHADDAVRFARRAQRWLWGAIVLQFLVFVWLIVRAVS